MVILDLSGCGVGCKLHNGERNVPGRSLVPVSLWSSHHPLLITMVEENGVVASVVEGPSKWPADSPERSEEVELLFQLAEGKCCSLFWALKKI